jgi:putative transposase
MSRPLRIEFKGAYYHVMNRGAGRQDIFAHDDHRLVFLELLREVHEMFRAEIHAYCLMDNHYHLLLSTPDGNLNRVMRHINGVYTQRYNRMEKTDGPLFRGRYKAILVDVGAYLLCVSRYIHLNPVAAGIVKKAHQFHCSSYRAYIGKIVPPVWLNTAETLGMVGERSRLQRYQDFVNGGVDLDTQRFYNDKKLSPIYGRQSFVKKMEKRLTPHHEVPEHRQVRPPISFSQLVECTAAVFNTEKAQILKASRGRGNYNTARGAAMYLSRKCAGHSLEDIANYFGLASYGSVSGQIHRFQKVLLCNADVRKLVKQIEQKVK